MERAARQWIRAMRGKRSQVALSRRLGYRGNVVAKWEGGARSPTFGEMLRAFARVGVDVPGALRRFHAPSAAAWDPARPEHIADWLVALQGQTSQALIAEKSGLSRQQIGRLLSGRTQGRLPMVMTVVDAMTGRLPDLVAETVPIELVPELARAAQVRQALSRLAFAHPWSPAAQSWLGCRRQVPAASAAEELAEGLGIELANAEVLIGALVEAGVAAIDGGTLRTASPASVEISATDEDVRRVRAHWAKVSADRMARYAPDDLFSFNVFAVSREDLAKIRQSQRRFYREVRAIVAESPPEVVALLVVHTAALVE
jgi:transcriptional regulator with XRE-family HTH domain